MICGNGLTTWDAKTGKRISANVIVRAPDGYGGELNATFATMVPGTSPDGEPIAIDHGFAFFVCGEGEGSVTLVAEGYESQRFAQTFPLPHNVAWMMQPVVVPVPVSIAGALAVDGEFFTSAGKPHTVIETSDFSLYRRYLDREPLAELVMAQRQRVGFNMQRVWLLNQSVIGTRNTDWRNGNKGPTDSGLHPKDFPQFYDALGSFVDTCGAFGQHVELTVFTQARTLMPSRDDQQRHVDRTYAAVRDRKNVIVELGNEIGEHDNAYFDTLAIPAGWIVSTGSNGSDQDPPEPHRSYVLYHSNDAAEFQRRCGHNAMEHAHRTGRPGIANENTRYPDRDASQVHAFDAAMGGALLCAGSCYHSWNGKQSTLFDDVELPFAMAWVAGARSVPLEFQHGQYFHLDKLEGPQCIRAYSRRLGDGREHVILIRP